MSESADSILAAFQLSHAACAQRALKLAEVLQKTQSIFPITPKKLAQLTTEQQETLDALILRYSQVASALQDQLFKSIALLEQENISDKSNRDKALLMEKLGAIPSAEQFGVVVLLRNKLTHHYPEDSALQLDRINQLPTQSDSILQALAQLSRYATSKGYLLEMHTG